MALCSTVNPLDSDPLFPNPRLFSQKSLLGYGVDLLDHVSSGGIKHEYSLKNQAVVHEAGAVLPSTIYVNCYGFMGHLLQTVYPGVYEDLLSRMETMDKCKGPNRIPKSVDGIPCPFTYFHIFDRLEEDDPYWERVPSIFDMLPGDIIAFQNPGFKPTDTWPKRVSSTGQHVMMVMKKPERLSEREVSVGILDCSLSLRSRNQRKGIGSCTYSIKTTEAKNVHFLKYKLTKRDASKRTLRIGRLKEPQIPIAVLPSDT